MRDLKRCEYPFQVLASTEQPSFYRADFDVHPAGNFFQREAFIVS